MPSASAEEKERIARKDQLDAQRGLVRLVRENGGVYHLHVEQLTRQKRPERIGDERAPVAWLKGRLEKLPPSLRPS